MATVINLKVKSDFAAASADLKKFGTLTESQAKKIDEFQKAFKDENIKSFNDRLTRSTAAIKATRGPTAAMRSEHRLLQREIEKLIRRGLDPAGKEIKQLTNQYKKLEIEIEDVTRAQKRSQASMKRTEGAMLAIGAGAVVMGKRAVDAFIDFSRESAQAASDAEEIEGKFNVVFRNISNDATLAAATIAGDFDLAASTVNKLLGDTGDILTGLGFDQQTALDLSSQVGTLALDLASFTNFAGGAEGASAALTKALLGEAESAKSLGIVIRQDTAEYKELVAQLMETEQVGLIQAKALAALQIATEQSQNAIGDYARTAESSANVQKILTERVKESKEIFGDIVNEGLTPWRKGISETIAEMNKLIKTQILQDRVTAGEAAAVEELILANSTLIDTQTELERRKQTLAARISALNNITDREISRQRTSREALQKRIETEKDSIETTERKIGSIAQNIAALQEQIQAENDFAQSIIDEATATEVAKEAAITKAEEQAILLEEQIQAESEAAAIRLNLRLSEEEAILDRDQRMADSAIAARDLRIKAEEDVAAVTLENNKKIKISFTDLATTGLGAITKGFADIGEAIATNSLGWKDFARLGLKALSAVLDGLGAQLAAQAAIAFFTPPFNIGAGVGLTAGSIAAFASSGLLSAAAGSFQTGTGQPFTVPETAGSSRADSRSINVSPGEEVSVSPRGEGGRSQNINVMIAEETIFRIVNRGIDSGDINITTENIQGGVGATA